MIRRLVAFFFDEVEPWLLGRRGAVPTLGEGSGLFAPALEQLGLPGHLELVAPPLRASLTAGPFAVGLTAGGTDGAGLTARSILGLSARAIDDGLGAGPHLSGLAAPATSTLGTRFLDLEST